MSTKLEKEREDLIKKYPNYEEQINNMSIEDINTIKYVIKVIDFWEEKQNKNNGENYEH